MIFFHSREVMPNEGEAFLVDSGWTISFGLPFWGLPRSGEVSGFAGDLLRSADIGLVGLHGLLVNLQLVCGLQIYV